MRCAVTRRAPAMDGKAQSLRARQFKSHAMRGFFVWARGEILTPDPCGSLRSIQRILA